MNREHEARQLNYHPALKPAVDSKLIYFTSGRKNMENSSTIKLCYSSLDLLSKLPNVCNIKTLHMFLLSLIPTY